MVFQGDESGGNIRAVIHVPKTTTVVLLFVVELKRRRFGCWIHGYLLGAGSSESRSQHDVTHSRF